MKTVSKFFLLAISLAALFSLSATPHHAIYQQTSCGYHAEIDAALAQITEDTYADWIRKLSGEEAVLLNGSPVEIKTRYSPALFNGNTNAQAFAWLMQELQRMGYTPEVHSYSYGGSTWKNIIITIPGTDAAQQHELVYLTAHFDSISGDPNNNAPGAEDNASGTAALLEAARLFKYQQFQRTIKIVFFSGEEQGLLGSGAYINSVPAFIPNMIGAVNLDMFGYDSNQDRCFEMHVGTLAASSTVGQCMASAISAYNLNLTYDYITSGATTSSDHRHFWNNNVGAIEVLENYSSNSLPGGCIGQDRNPNYHKTTDKLETMYLPAATDIARAGVGTAAGLALPYGNCFNEVVELMAIKFADHHELRWSSVADAASYRVYRAEAGYDGGMFDLIATLHAETTFEDWSINPESDYTYYIEAVGSNGVCTSQPGNHAEPAYYTLFPLIFNHH